MGDQERRGETKHLAHREGAQRVNTWADHERGPQGGVVREFLAGLFKSIVLSAVLACQRGDEVGPVTSSLEGARPRTKQCTCQAACLFAGDIQLSELAVVRFASCDVQKP